MTETTGGRRGGGRAARQAARAVSDAVSVPYITRALTPFEVLSEEHLSLIEENADTILEQVGIDFRDTPEALSLFAEAGAEIDGERVRFPRGLARHIVQATAPSRFTQVARNPKHNVEMGGTNTVFAPAYGSPFVRDLDNGRRYGTIEDFRNFVKLTFMTPYLHHSGGTVCEPVDLPVNKRHYDMVYAHMRYSDKAFMGSVTHPSRAEDTVAMARILFGGDFLETNTVIVSLANANSPMVWDSTMLGAAKAYAEANQGVLITPFILAGAMSPATVVGAASQTLAEALAGMAFCQLVRPGAPVILGSFASSMSMQSGAPTFGTPEPALILYVMAALARRLGVPFRSGGALTASKIADAQAAYESANTMQPTMLAGVNFVLHTAGWLEGGLAMGYEKFILDVDQAAAWHAFAKGVDMSPNGQALDAILSNEPGTHFLGHPHTLANFESAFWRSSNADNGSFEQWDLDGREGRERAGQRDLEEDARRVRAAADRRRGRRGAARVHRAGQGLLPGLERLMAATSMPVGQAATVAELLTRSRYEVIPLAGAEEQVLEHVPRDVTLTVTASPVKGLDHTLDLVARLAGHGYPVVPHLSARLVVDRTHLTELIARFDRARCARRFRRGRRRRPARGRVRGRVRTPRRDERGRASVRPDRDHGLSGEPSADRRRDDDRVHVREGPSCDLHREPDLLRLAGHGRLDRQRLGARDAAAHPRRASRASCPAGSSCASRPGSESANRFATCASTATSRRGSCGPAGSAPTA